MTLKISESELERLLRGEPGASLRAPEGLLARLRADLPAELPQDLPQDPPLPSPGPADILRQPRWSSRSLLSLAATLAVVAGGSFLALRALRETPPPGQVFSDLAASSSREQDAVAPQAPAAPERAATEQAARARVAELKKEAAPPPKPAEIPGLRVTPPPPPAVAPPASRPAPVPAAEAASGVGSERFEPQKAAAQMPASAPQSANLELGVAGSVPGGAPGGVPGGIAGGSPGTAVGRNSYEEIRVIPLKELEGRDPEEKLAAATGEDEERRADEAGAGKADPAEKAKAQPIVFPLRATGGAAKDQPVDLRDPEGRRRARQLESPTVQGDAKFGPPPAAAAPREPRTAASDPGAAAWEAIEMSLASGIWPSFQLLEAARLPPGGAGKKTAGREADSAADPVIKLREQCLDFFGKMEKNRSDLTPLRRRALRLYDRRPNDPRLAELVRLLNLASHILPD